MKQSGVSLKVATVLLLSSGVELQAAGFYLKEQSIVSQGQAFAGVAAQSGLASSTYFNPAGLNSIEQPTFEGGLHLLLLDQKVTDNGSTGGAANISDQTPLSNSIIPNLYWAQPVGDGVVGVGINAPFGSKNEYQSDYFGKYDHVSADLKTVDYTLALSQKFDESLSLGASLFYQTLDVEQNKISTTNTLSTLEGNAADFGFSVGLQYQLNKTVFGFSHRSGTTHNIVGTLSGVYATTAEMRLPAITALGVEHELNNKVDLYVGVTHYDWSVYDQLTTVSTGVPLIGTLIATAYNNYNDTVSYSLGGNYRYRTDLELRAGFHFDPTPTNDTDRSHSTPDGDRTWLSFGGSKRLDRNLLVDFAYSYIHMDDSAVNKEVLDSAGSLPGQNSVVRPCIRS